MLMDVKKIMKHERIQIYTDGSCKGNPGPGGWAVLFTEPDEKKPFATLKGHEASTTNNRMEMVAVIEALRYIDVNKFHTCDITLYSDSNLVIQTMLQGWKRKANLDLWEELDELNEELDIEYVWVKGHHKNHWNNECDRIAQRQASISQKNGATSPRSVTRTKQRKLF